MTKKTKEPTFEERLNRLHIIVAALESGEKPLEESVTLYKEGLAHAAACREQLAKARHDIEVYSDGVCAPLVNLEGADGEESFGEAEPGESPLNRLDRP